MNLKEKINSKIFSKSLDVGVDKTIEYYDLFTQGLGDISETINEIAAKLKNDKVDEFCKSILSKIRRRKEKVP